MSKAFYLKFKILSESTLSLPWNTQKLLFDLSYTDILHGYETQTVCTFGFETTIWCSQNSVHVRRDTMYKQCSEGGRLTCYKDHVLGAHDWQVGTKSIMFRQYILCLHPYRLHVHQQSGNVISKNTQPVRPDMAVKPFWCASHTAI